MLLASVDGQTVPTAPPLPPPRAGYSFPQKQTLTYSVDWRVFPAGTVTMHLETDGNMERVTVTADSIEGRRQVNTDLKFNYAQNKAILNEKNLVSGISKHQEAPIPSCVTDLLSALFYTASQPLAAGQSFQVPVADAMKTIPVTMKVEDGEVVRTPLGTYQTIRVQPTADTGVVKNRGNIWIWYTDDDRHIPVQMRARLFWGTITFQLTAIEQK
jgi:hypothetical protein